MQDEFLGILEILPGGSGFIRRRADAYLAGRDDPYVSQAIISSHELRTGDEIAGEVGHAPARKKSPPLQRITSVNGRPPEEVKGRPDFQRLSAIHPNEQLVLECRNGRQARVNYTNRVIDLFCPFGKGQRALIVSPAKAGKTTVLQSVAEGIVTNYPRCTLLILLVDERPEEVTEMEACGFGEVIASSFDHPADRHVAIAEITLERARRRAEMGDDVVLVLDSITRLARAYNTVAEGSGRTLSGGLDAQSLEKPKRFLGSARKVDPDQGGGSLTIIATALVDTGSRMDQVIFEEFKGTGNSELVLSRDLADRRIFPAIDLVASATRREELLLAEAALEASRLLRRELAGADPADAMTRVLAAMKRTESNAELTKQVLGR